MVMLSYKVPHRELKLFRGQRWRSLMRSTYLLSSKCNRAVTERPNDRVVKRSEMWRSAHEHHLDIAGFTCFLLWHNRKRIWPVKSTSSVCSLQVRNTVTEGMLPWSWRARRPTQPSQCSWSIMAARWQHAVPDRNTVIIQCSDAVGWQQEGHPAGKMHCHNNSQKRTFGDQPYFQSNPMSITAAGQGLYFRLFLKFKIQKHK